MFTKQLLTSLKERLNEKGRLLKTTPEGVNIEVVCTFEEPASPEEIIQAEKDFKMKFPDDYKEFLLQHNGASLFSGIEYGEEIGGELWLFSIEEIKEAIEDYKIEKGKFLPIGAVLDQSLAISSEPLKKGSLNYLGIAEIVDHYEPINLNFELFLSRFITTLGENFWEWDSWTADNYYEEDEGY